MAPIPPTLPVVLSTLSYWAICSQQADPYWWYHVASLAVWLSYCSTNGWQWQEGGRRERSENLPRGISPWWCLAMAMLSPRWQLLSHRPTPMAITPHLLITSTSFCPRMSHFEILPHTVSVPLSLPKPLHLLPLLNFSLIPLILPSVCCTGSNW